MSETEVVLYVDGDPDQRQRVATRLRDAAHDVATAPDVDQAVELLGDRAVDVVVSEYRLPDADGLTFFDRIYSQFPGVAFLLFTAHGSERLAGEAVAAGVDGYVPKGEGVETLVDRVARAVEVGDRGRVGDTRAEGDRSLPASVEAFETLGDGVYALDDRGYFTSVSGRLVSASGYTREELVGTHATTVLDESDLQAASDRLTELFTGDGARAVTFEVDLIDKDGRRVPCEVSAAPVRDGDEFAGSVGVVWDVTERKRIGRRLREQKDRIESLHRTASRLGECRTPAEVYETTVEAAKRVLGFDGSAIHVVDPSGSDLVPHTWTGTDEARTYSVPFPVEGSIQGEAFRTGETMRVDDCSGEGPEMGPYRSLLAIPVRDRELFQAVSTDPGAFSEDDAEIAEILLAHAGDALERVDFEGKLRTERDRFAALFENVPDPVVDAEHDEAGGPVVRAVNPAFERVFGFDGDAVRGERLDEVVVPRTRAAREEARDINERVRSGEAVEREVQRRTADGLRTFLLTVVPVDQDGAATRRFALYTDITERKQRQQRVEVLNRVLRHDLRNNLNVIQTATEALVGHVDEGGQEYLDVIDDRSAELVSVAETTRTIERALDAEELSTEPVDVVGAVGRAVDVVTDQFPDADVATSGPSRALVAGDEFLDAAIENVVENAVEHNDSDRPRVRVTVDPDARGRTVAVRVADDGPGIPEPERELLVEDREITQLRHASGLGLWLVNWIVTRLGGDLDIDDNEPRGTVVTLRFPETDVEAATGESRADAAPDDE